MSRSPAPAPHPSASKRRLPIAVIFGLWVFAAGLLLTIVSAVLRLTWRFDDLFPAALRPLFIVNQEFSILSWLSITVVSVLGLSCLAAARLDRRRGWYPIALLFLYLSMDDFTTLHERIGWLLTGANGDSTVYWWIRVMGPILAIIGLFTFAFLFRRFRGDRRAQLTTLLGFGMLALALMCEIPERFFSESSFRLRGFKITRYTVHLEEFCELIGPVLILVPIGILVERLIVEATGVGNRSTRSLQSAESDAPATPRKVA